METLQILACLLLLTGGGWAALRVRKWIADFKMKRRFSIGAQAEKSAAKRSFGGKGKLEPPKIQKQ